MDLKTAEQKEYQVPEWEHTKTHTHCEGGPTESIKKSLKTLCLEKLDSSLPPHRRYLRMSRNVFLMVLAGGVLALLALVVGLAAGLTHHSCVPIPAHGRTTLTGLFRRSKDLPLPSNAQTFTGDLTYFEPGLGACGETDTSSDMIVALSHLLFDAAGSSSAHGGNSNMNPLCNKILRAERYDEQYGTMKSVDLKVVDRCVGCAMYDLDTTEGAFSQLAPIPSGRVDVTWAWLQPVATGT